MLSIDCYKGQKVAIFGLGRSGFSSALALRRGGATPVCWDDSKTARDNAQTAGLIIEDLRVSKTWNEFSLLLLSPGIPYIYPQVNQIVEQAWRHQVPIDNDVSLFFQSYSQAFDDKASGMPRTIAVTGSNGKSTTSTLIHHILNGSNRNVQIGGNIGTPLFDLSPANIVETTVMELSSYQIEVAKLLIPDIAVFLNFSPDHLDRHGGIGGYFSAKRRLFKSNQNQISVVGVDEKEGLAITSDLRSRKGSQVIKISTKINLTHDEQSVFSDGRNLFECKLGKIVNKLDITNLAGLPGNHNLQNICAAYAVCRVLEISPKDIFIALKSYNALPHRTELIATLSGVKFINDSKATNATSTLSALNSFSNIHWIAGGRGKGDGITSLMEHLGSVKRTYLIGESALDFSVQISGSPQSIFQTLDEALAAAYKNAIPGDTVLLSPGAASFDQYANFEQRGLHFSKLVSELEI